IAIDVAWQMPRSRLVKWAGRLAGRERDGLMLPQFVPTKSCRYPLNLTFQIRREHREPMIFPDRMAQVLRTGMAGAAVFAGGRGGGGGGGVGEGRGHTRRDRRPRARPLPTQPHLTRSNNTINSLIRSGPNNANLQKPSSGLRPKTMSSLTTVAGSISR